MKRTVWVAALAGLALSCNALAVGGLATVSVIDRDSGTQLSSYYFKGEYWVAGRPGARYAIEIRNCAAGRLLAVTSVDGINVISGATAGWAQNGYVFDPGADYQIAGWRKSDTEVADFTFTASPNSYAARTGRPANVGVIGVALFRERPGAPPRITQSPNPADAPRAEASARDSAREAPAAAAGGSLGANTADERVASVAPSVPAPKLGTGHGEREYSYVENTEFRRMQREPNEVIRIRYDSFENLVALGVVAASRVAPMPNPFPVSHGRGFVPDPPG